MQGICQWFDPARGYGFCKPDDGSADVFVHQSNLVMPGFRTLDQGQRIEFDIEKTPRGRKAVNCRPLSTVPPLQAQPARAAQLPVDYYRSSFANANNCNRQRPHWPRDNGKCGCGRIKCGRGSDVADIGSLRSGIRHWQRDE